MGRDELAYARVGENLCQFVVRQVGQVREIGQVSISENLWDRSDSRGGGLCRFGRELDRISSRRACNRREYRGRCRRSGGELDRIRARRTRRKSGRDDKKRRWPNARSTVPSCHGQVCCRLKI